MFLLFIYEPLVLSFKLSFTLDLAGIIIHAQTEREGCGYLKIFCGIQTYSCDKIQLIQWYDNEDGKKSERGVKGTKNKRLSPKSSTDASLTNGINY